jgi:hypothetical protein
MLHQTRTLLNEFGGDTIDHSAQSPDFALSDYRMFRAFKRLLSGQKVRRVSRHSWLPKAAGQWYCNVAFLYRLGNCYVSMTTEFEPTVKRRRCRMVAILCTTTLYKSAHFIFLYNYR